MVVYCDTADGEYTQLARDIADDSNSRVETNDVDLDTAGEVVYYVAPPEDVSAKRIHRLQTELYDRYDHEVPFAIITGRTVAQARSLYAREPSARARNAMVVRGTSESVDVRDDRTTLLLGSDVTVDNLEDACTSEFGSFSLTANGTDIHVYLKDGFLCGVPKDEDQFDFSGVQPPCTVTGDRDCPREGELLLGDDVTASQVFLNSCSSVVPNNEVGMPVNLGLGMLSNATSLIGTYRVVNVEPYQTALHHSLSRAGYDANERTYLLNRSATADGVETYPYALFGNPEGRLVDAREPQYSASIETAADGVSVRVDDIDGHVVDVTFTHDGDASNLVVREEGDPQFDNTHYYTLFSEGDSLRLLVYSWDGIEPDSLRLRVGRRAADRDLLESFERLEVAEDISVVTGKARGQIRNARNMAKGTVELFDRERYELGVSNRIAERFEQAESAVRQAQESLADELAERRPGPFKMRYADDTYNVDARVAEDACPHCGRDLHLHTRQSVSGRVRRSLAQCPKCAYVFDVPDDGSSLTYPVVSGDVSTIPGDRATDVEVVFRNPTDREMDALYAAVPNTGGEYATELTAPRTRRVTLPPGESRAAEFELDASAMDPYRYDGKLVLDGYVITDRLDVYVAMRTVFNTVE